MRRINHATIKVDNDEVRKAIAEDIKGLYSGFSNEGVTLHATDRTDDIHSKLKEISKQYPEVVIRTEHTLSTDKHEKVYSVNYVSGKSETIGEEYNYIFLEFKAPRGYSKEQIKRMVLDEFKRVDALSEAAGTDRRLKKIKGGLNQGIDQELILIDMTRIDLEDIVIQATVELNLVKIRVWEKEIILKELI